jgi:hypothetical protein
MRSLVTANESESSRHIPCAVHLESWQEFDCEGNGGACLDFVGCVALVTLEVAYYR